MIGIFASLTELNPDMQENRALIELRQRLPSCEHPAYSEMLCLRDRTKTDGYVCRMEETCQYRTII